METVYSANQSEFIRFFSAGIEHLSQIRYSARMKKQYGLA